MQVVGDKITVSDKDAKPLSTFIRGQSVVGTAAISAGLQGYQIGRIRVIINRVDLFEEKCEAEFAELFR